MTLIRRCENEEGSHSRRVSGSWWHPRVRHASNLAVQLTLGSGLRLGSGLGVGLGFSSDTVCHTLDVVPSMQPLSLILPFEMDPYLKTLSPALALTAMVAPLDTTWGPGQRRDPEPTPCYHSKHVL